MNSETFTLENAIYKKDFITAEKILSEKGSDFIDLNRIFLTCCYGGALPIVKWVYSKNPKMDFMDGFHRACVQGHFKTAKWLLYIQPLIKEEIQQFGGRIFEKVCFEGHFKVFELLRPFMNTYHLERYIYTALSNGHLNIVKRILFKNPDLIELKMNSLRVNCMRGHLKNAKWIYSKIKNPLKNEYTSIEARSATPDDSEKMNYLTFFEVCRNNHLDVAKWLISIYPQIDISHRENYIFYQVCSNGYLEMAKWLFSLNPQNDLSSTIDNVYYDVCTKGHFDVVQWLYSINHSIPVDGDLFIDTCTNGHIEIAKWIIDIEPQYMTILEEDVLIQEVCSNNQLEIAQWLLSLKPNIPLELEDHLIFKTACEKRHIDMIDWLKSLYPHLYNYEFDEEEYMYRPIIILYSPHIQTKEVDEVFDCSICWDKKSTQVTQCGHQFCTYCLSTWIDRSRSCPSCRNVLHIQTSIFYIDKK